MQQAEWTFQSVSHTRLAEKILRAGRPLGEVVNGQIYRGLTTGLNEAFVIDRPTKDQLIQADPASAAIIKPTIRGEDLRPWYQEDEDKWIIFTRRGIDIDAYPAVKAYLQQFRESLEPRPDDWNSTTKWAGRKQGSYQWYEIQDTVEYYPAFEKLKIFWPDIAKLPRFSWDDQGKYITNTGYIIPAAAPFLLGLFQSRVFWFAISQICQPLRLRAGLWQYRLLPQFVSRLPVPGVAEAEQATLGALALVITGQALARYTLHRQVRHRILTDLGRPGQSLNQKLFRWWELDFPAFRSQVTTALKREIPLKDRDEWEAWLTAQRAAHQRYTAEIFRQETELNQQVYGLFELNPAEVKIIEGSTLYKYGEV